MTCRNKWTLGQGGERGSGISVLMAWHDDDNDVCVCVYVWNIQMLRRTDMYMFFHLSFFPHNSHNLHGIVFWQFPCRSKSIFNYLLTQLPSMCQSTKDSKSLNQKIEDVLILKSFSRHRLNEALIKTICSQPSASHVPLSQRHTQRDVNE